MDPFALLSAGARYGKLTPPRPPAAAMGPAVPLPGALHSSYTAVASPARCTNQQQQHRRLQVQLHIYVITFYQSAAFGFCLHVAQQHPLLLCCSSMYSEVLLSGQLGGGSASKSSSKSANKRRKGSTTPKAAAASGAAAGCMLCPPNQAL
jgi:hypothetical protein